jgi:hypothetical protein
MKKIQVSAILCLEFYFENIDKHVRILF